MEVKIYTDVGQLQKAIDGIAKRGHDLGTQIQGAAVSCILMAADNGNTNPAAYLFNKLGAVDPKRSSINRKALGDWLKAYGIGIRFDKTTGNFKAKLSAEAIEKTRAALAADKQQATTKMLNHSFTSLDSAARDFSGFDLPARIVSLLKAVEKIQGDKEKAQHPNNNMTGFAALRALAEQMKTHVKKTSEPAKGA